MPIPTSGGRRAVQSAGPASEGEAVGVVRRALTAQVVVHAPTLAMACTTSYGSGGAQPGPLE